MSSFIMSSIPIIDFSDCSVDVAQDIITEDYSKVGHLLYDALSTCGFAYLKNSGIREESVAKVNKVTEQFFHSSVDEKKKYSRTPDNFGYVSLEMESLNLSRPGDYKEAFNVSGDALENPEARWPSELCPDFSSTVKEFMENCKLLCNRVLKALAVGMELEDENYFAKAHALIHKKGNQTTLRSLYYPPLPSDMQVNQIRLGEHSDYGSITLLFQDDIGGLQVQNLSGEYVDAKPIDDTVVINIGDLLQFWSRNKLKSTKHRVLNPDDPVKRSTLRRSLVYFVHPDDVTRVDTPLVYKDRSLNDNSSLPVKGLTAFDYLQQKFVKTY